MTSGLFVSDPYEEWILFVTFTSEGATKLGTVLFHVADLLLFVVKYLATCTLFHCLVAFVFLVYQLVKASQQDVKLAAERNKRNQKRKKYPAYLQRRQAPLPKPRTLSGYERLANSLYATILYLREQIQCESCAKHNPSPISSSRPVSSDRASSQQQKATGSRGDANEGCLSEQPACTVSDTSDNAIGSFKSVEGCEVATRCAHSVDGNVLKEMDVCSSIGTIAQSRTTGPPKEVKSNVKPKPRPRHRNTISACGGNSNGKHKPHRNIESLVQEFKSKRNSLPNISENRVLEIPSAPPQISLPNCPPLLHSPPSDKNMSAIPSTLGMDSETEVESGTCTGPELNKHIRKRDSPPPYNSLVCRGSSEDGVELSIAKSGFLFVRLFVSSEDGSLTHFGTPTTFEKVFCEIKGNILFLRRTKTDGCPSISKTINLRRSTVEIEDELSKENGKVTILHVSIIAENDDVCVIKWENSATTYMEEWFQLMYEISSKGKQIGNSIMSELVGSLASSSSKDMRRPPSSLRGTTKARYSLTSSRPKPRRLAPRPSISSLYPDLKTLKP
eukprot:Nk52_evm4s246 gene=Nk52_evmTU4s246